MTLHCVYYCYNAEGEMLYIGCTKQMLERLTCHKSKSAWVPYLHKIRLRWFDSFGEARRFEEEAIYRNRPEYNRYTNGTSARVSPKKEFLAPNDDWPQRLKLIRASLKKRIARASKLQAAQ